MFIKGTAQIQTFTFEFSIHGERGNWTVRVTSPGGIVTSDETSERTWYPLFTELLSAASENASRRRGQPARPGIVP